MNKMKVCAIVIWFNPTQKNWEVIQKYLSFVDKCIIVDNSNKDNSFLINKKFKKIVYIPNLDNFGIAKALNIGCKKAKSIGFNWVLTMDDDSFFDKKNYDNYLREVKKIIKEDKKAVSFSPNFSKNKSSPFSKVNRIITSGNLIKLSVLNSIGYYREDLFIYEVDIDLSYRLFNQGYKLYELHNIQMHHNIFDSPLKLNLFFKEYNIRKKDSPESKYYLLRNGLLMNKEYFNIRKNEFFKYYFFPLRLLIKIILFEEKKIKKLKYFFRGYIDFKKRRFGKCPLLR
jgi:rhamnosyltransferase